MTIRPSKINIRKILKEKFKNWIGMSLYTIIASYSKNFYSIDPMMLEKNGEILRPIFD